MPEKFKNKYTIKSARLQNYDYSQNGMYLPRRQAGFVTICTKDKEYFFGEIKNGTMVLSDVGKMADKYWREIPAHFPFVKLDEFVVMPNHVHGIVEIVRDEINNDCGGGVSCRDEALPRLYFFQKFCQSTLFSH
ncbi:MAG: hypothetical protein US30_C0013G0028 [Candidatus Moranbacteria bacterium GW2011_GWF2_36_839]|nr:MAG: hypothetical protein US27_C0013G0028 [Candidatus Moranbacteria bacterium GW2011_GWF1_36_78]KKQ16631.1 MAG: hypothetical protein US30_C0013G0028 [Candidatus Moranbacteria bacterium GW2011_GWF2_36_839]